MNSSIQCLAHTVPLLRQLLHGRYKSQVNKENPLGMKGELADAFGSLLDAMWQVGRCFNCPSMACSTLHKNVGLVCLCVLLLGCNGRAG